jgi:ABC-2 type transport system permease protein
MNAGVLIAKDLRRQWRDRRAFLLQFAAPLLVTGIMGLSFGGGVFGDTSISAIPIAVVGGDVPAVLQDQLQQSLQRSGFFTVTWADSATADDLVRRGKLQAAIVLPPKLLTRLLSGRDVVLQLWKDPNSQIKAGIVETILTESLRELQAGEAAYRALWPQDEITPEDFDDGPVAAALEGNPLRLWEALRKPDDAGGGADGTDFGTLLDRGAAFGQAMGDHRVGLVVRDRADWDVTDDPARQRSLFDYFLPAIAVFFMMFSVAAVVRDYHRERDNRTLSRVLLAPVSSTEVLLGKFGTAIVAGVVQLCVLFAVGAAVFGMNLGRAPALLLLTIVLACSAAASFYLVLGLLARTEKAMDALTTVATLVAGMVGGNFFPIDLMPSTLHLAGQVTFNYWANRAFSDLIIHDGAWRVVAPALGALVGFTAIGLVASLTVLAAKRRRGVAA